MFVQMIGVTKVQVDEFSLFNSLNLGEDVDVMSRDCSKFPVARYLTVVVGGVHELRFLRFTADEYYPDLPLFRYLI